MMLLGVLDAVRSTDRAEKEGFAATERLQGQLQDLAALIKRQTDVERWVGEFQGDGFLFAADEGYALPLLVEFLKLQREDFTHPDWLPLRVSLALGAPVWTGPAWAPTSTFTGRDVMLVARRLEVCPPGGLILDDSLHRRVREHQPALKSFFTQQDVTLQGVDGIERCWVMGEVGQAVMNGKRGLSWTTLGKGLAVVTVVLLLSGMVWANQRQHERLEGALQALIWTLCESTPTCKAKSIEEPAYLRMLRQQQRTTP